MRGQEYSAIEPRLQDEQSTRREGINFDELYVVLRPAASCLPDTLYFGDFSI